ncbi:MAG: hypothetical protein WBJ68_00030 [Candidatus Dechloromonas phosphoritropha]
MIETEPGKSDIFFGDAIKAHFLGEELPNEAVHILVGPAFPRSIGVGEVAISLELLGKSLMLSKLLPVIRRQCVDSVRERRQQGNHRI